ncbi:MAG TPA: hypothetical protein PLK99_11335, partial [Burkholderiales bacterium]|nr:hypothetical protein [Burkholderiales bacterium]
IEETPEQKAMIGKLILQALHCEDFAGYLEIQGKWAELSEETASLHAAPNCIDPDIYHQYMQANIQVSDDYGQAVSDYFLEFFSNTEKADDAANVYLHRQVIEDVKINSQNPSMRNLYFDRTDLIGGYYPMVAEDVLYLSISAASPGKNIRYFGREAIGAEQQIPIYSKQDIGQRWLKRNSTHFVKIIIPRLPAENAFRLTRYDRA